MATVYSFHYYHSYDDYLGHPFFKAARAVAMRRAGWRCEECRVTVATEVHHLRYPPWGTFDLPSNLKAVCHECHCKIEGKAS